MSDFDEGVDFLFDYRLFVVEGDESEAEIPPDCLIAGVYLSLMPNQRIVLRKVIAGRDYLLSWNNKKLWSFFALSLYIYVFWRKFLLSMTQFLNVFYSYLFVKVYHYLQYRVCKNSREHFRKWKILIKCYLYNNPIQLKKRIKFNPMKKEFWKTRGSWGSLGKFNKILKLYSLNLFYAFLCTHNRRFEIFHELNKSFS